MFWENKSVNNDKEIFFFRSRTFFSVGAFSVLNSFLLEIWEKYIIMKTFIAGYLLIQSMSVIHTLSLKFCFVNYMDQGLARLAIDTKKNQYITWHALVCPIWTLYFSLPPSPLHPTESCRKIYCWIWISRSGFMVSVQCGFGAKHELWFLRVGHNIGRTHSKK